MRRSQIRSRPSPGPARALRSRMKFPHTIHCSIQGTGKRLGAREARCARFCFRPNTWKRILSVKPCFWRPCGGPIYAGVGIQPKSLTHQCARLQSLHRIRAPSTLRDFVPRIAFLFLEYFRPLPTGQTPVAYAIRASQLFEFRIWDGTWVLYARLTGNPGNMAYLSQLFSNGRW